MSSSSSSCSGGGRRSGSSGSKRHGAPKLQQAPATAAFGSASSGASTIGRPSEASTMTATHSGGGGGVAVSPGGGSAAAASASAGGGARSPPFRGRTMKEYEEMLNQLRKENFNLKLRLYFLEERGGGAAGDGCGGDAAGAELRLELEQLRRDAADKQQLLCEAARAVELLEEQHRDQLRAARHAAQQAHVEAQQARAHAQQLAAEAQRAREEAEAEVAAAKKAAADAAAEAALENERLRMELMQTREAAQEAAESARVARLAAAASAAAAASRQQSSPPLSPRSPLSPLSRSPSSATEGVGGAWGCGAAVRGAVERAQAQLSALEAELAAVRAELRRQTEARAAAERGLAEGRAVHAKSLQTVQALARLCKERDKEAEGLRARLQERQQCNSSGETEERGRASGDEGVATPRPTPTGSPAPLPPSASSPTPTGKRLATPDDDNNNDGAAAATTGGGESNENSGNNDKSGARGLLLDVSTAALLRTNVTLRRNVESGGGGGAVVEEEDERQRLLLQQLRAQLEDRNEHLRELAAERDALSGGLVRRLQALQVQAREHEGALASRDEKLRLAEERAQRLEEEVQRLRAASANERRSSTPPRDKDSEQTAEPVAPAPPEDGEDEKDRLIARLRSELRQRTANLQELVNKELWDKNRQIERLQERLARLGSPAAAAAVTTTPVHQEQQRKAAAAASSSSSAPTTPTHKSGVEEEEEEEESRCSLSSPPPRRSIATSLPALLLPPAPTPTPPPPPACSTPSFATAVSADADSTTSSQPPPPTAAPPRADAGEEEEDEEAALRRRLEESVKERASLSAQLDDLRRRLHDASASAAATSTCSESGVVPVAGRESELAVAAAVAEAAQARAAQARAEADRRDALTACSALARRLDALARALPPLLRRHQHHQHGSRATTRASERRSASGGGGGGSSASAGGGGGGRRLRALERALSAAARAARALGGVEGAAEFALLHQVEGSADVAASIATPVDIAVNVSGAAGDGSPKAVWSIMEQGKLEESAPADCQKRVSESEVDAWSEPDRTVSLARVGLSPLSDQRAAAATISASSDEELDEAASHISHTGDPWASDDTIDSAAEKVTGAEASEIQKLQARVAELETRVCEKDNELLEQQCALLEMRNTYTARCLQAEGQLSELLVQVRQVQADAEAERRSVRDQVTNTSEGKESMDVTVGSPAKSQDNASACDGDAVALADRAQAAAEAMEVERLSAEFALGLQQQIQVNEARQREAEAERRRREADAALLQQRDAAAMAQSRAALERTQLLGERVRLERALRREEAAAAAAARAYRHERRQLQDQVLSLQANNHKLNRQLADISVLHLSPPLSPSAIHQSSLQRISGGGVCSPHNMPSHHANMDHHLGVCPLSTSYRLSRGEELGSLGSGLDAESLGSGSPPPAPLSSPQLPPGSPWQLNTPHSLPSFSRQHSALSTGYASTGDCGLATSPQTCGGSFNWITRPPGEPSHGAGSPDLGIESDAGRFSSLEPLSSHCGSCDQEPTQGLCGFQGTEVESDFARLQKENNTLRRNLSRTKKLLEATVTQLSTSNQMKRQMEMAICKQLNKTHSVLKQVKADSEVSVEPVK